MEISVLIEPINANSFRASCSDPIAASAEGTNREEALERLRAVLAERIQAGSEVVRLRLNIPHTKPLWPDDEFTRQWLAAIAENRAANHPDPWDTTP